MTEKKDNVNTTASHVEKHHVPLVPKVPSSFFVPAAAIDSIVRYHV